MLLSFGFLLSSIYASCCVTSMFRFPEVLTDCHAAPVLMQLLCASLRVSSFRSTSTRCGNCDDDLSLAGMVVEHVGAGRRNDVVFLSFCYCCCCCCCCCCCSRAWGRCPDDDDIAPQPSTCRSLVVAGRRSVVVAHVCRRCRCCLGNRNPRDDLDRCPRQRFGSLEFKLCQQKGTRTFTSVMCLTINTVDASC